jgi:outer membrane protein OmpA-like peptidoglycan-associated protein
MKHILAATVLTGAMLAGGCATKKYVRNTTAPVQSKVDQVAEQTTKHGTAIEENKTQIKTVQEQAESGISAAKERAMSAETRANDAMTKATQAGDAATEARNVANKATENINNLSQVVNNLDDYKLQSEVTIPFKFNKWQLDQSAKEKLDSLVNDKNKFKRYYIAVEGFADKTGTADYNAALSRKRADAVVQYLVANHDIPVYRIHMIGLGSQKPAEEGNTRAARAKNRRVEVRIFSADQGATVSQLK